MKECTESADGRHRFGTTEASGNTCRACGFYGGRAAPPAPKQDELTFVRGQLAEARARIAELEARLADAQKASS